MFLVLKMVNEPDFVSFNLGIPLALILWTIVLILVLVGLRQRKVRLDEKRRIEKMSRRRETFIQIANEQEEAYVESLKNQGISRET